MTKPIKWLCTQRRLRDVDNIYIILVTDEMSRLMTKPTKWHVHPAKTQMSLGIRPVWSESSLCAQWVAKDPSFLHADSDLSLRWAHNHFVGFVMRQLIYFLNNGQTFISSLKLVLSERKNNNKQAKLNIGSLFVNTCCMTLSICSKRGLVAQSDACPPGMRMVMGSILESNEIISTAILSLLLIQVGHLSVTDERMCT